MRQVGAIGPVDLAAGATHVYTFVVSGADNLTDFRANVVRARQKIATLH